MSDVQTQYRTQSLKLYMHNSELELKGDCYSVECSALHTAIAKRTESIISRWEASTSSFTALNSMSF